MRIEIKSRFDTSKVLWACDAESVREALEKAVAEGANLAHADLEGADLRDANLVRANLVGANLPGANLRDANLVRANLRDANLVRANLSSVYLPDANLVRANLRGADLRDADLRDADLRGANLRDADLRDANLVGANLTSANLTSANLEGALSGAPVVENLDAKILAAIEQGGALEMATWHSCETTHCRAGWAIHLAGEEGYALENRFGPWTAGALIYLASTGRVPDFYGSNEAALADIRRCAEWSGP